METARLGYQLVRSILDPHQVAEWRKRADSLRGQTAGIRRVFERIPETLLLAHSGPVMEAIEAFLGAQARPVRSILFDKSSEANWAVPWHQDLTIAVRQRLPLDGFGPWSLKDGQLHVQPPQEILQQMAAIRLHLDDCGVTNGALRVVPGSHRLGRIPQSEIEHHVRSLGIVESPARAGDARIMSPLVLHASSKAVEPSRRRVLHIEYCAVQVQLPGGLEWAEGDAAPTGTSQSRAW